MRATANARATGPTARRSAVATLTCATFANAYTERVRNVVVESGPARLGEWIDYARDVADDYRRAFGEAPGRISGVAIMTDADNTKSRASALFGDLTLDARGR
jgi:hypothetical protein